MEAVSGGAIKGLVNAVSRPIYDELKKQWKNRGADDFDPTRFATIDPELDAALELLTGDSATLGQTAKQFFSSKLSGVPQELQTDTAREWLRRDDVRPLLKAAVRNHIDQQPWLQNEEAAKAIYHQISGDFEWYGGVLFDWSVAFMALYLLARLTPGERLAAENSAKINAKLDEVLSRLPETGSATSAAPTGVVDQFLAKQLENQNRFRAIGILEDQARDAVEIATRALDGDLSNASIGLKISACKYAASALARDAQAEIAEEWIRRATDLGANDTYSEHARIAIARGDWTAALKHLDGKEDALARSLQLDILNRRDGPLAAINFFEKFYEPRSVNGFVLASISHWMFELGRVEDSERLLAEATPDQISENPNLLFSRMNCRLALATSESRRTAILANMVLPPHKALRDDSIGKDLRRKALMDCQALLAEMNTAGMKRFVDVIEQYEFYLRLSSPDQAIANKAREELLDRLASPDVAVVSVPLATSFSVKFDATLVKEQLERAKLLGGWDKDHLKAALDLVILENSPQNVAEFCETHETEMLEAFEVSYAAGIFIEALSKSGRLAEAQEKLNQYEAGLPDVDRGLLNGIIASQNGGNNVDIQLANFVASNDDRDLKLLVHALQVAKTAGSPHMRPSYGGAPI